MTFWEALAGEISLHSGSAFNPGVPRQVGGGCINESLVLRDGDQQWFVKVNQAGRLGMFEAEADGLSALARSGQLAVPNPLCFGAHEDGAFLVMEYLPLGGGGDSVAAGRALARMHRQRSDTFGWHRDNTIGATPQPNTPDTDWVEFWRERRLGFQLDLAARNGHGGQLQRLGERLMADLHQLLEHDPDPSLIHGDLWGGNFSFTLDGTPAIYDPACYYADFEAELAMTELFGGFGRDFYRGYAEITPITPGYDTRRTLYNLYHVLNHLNLFGSGYLNQAQRMLEQLLAELRA